MQYKKLGNTDLLFSAIGLGTWAMGGADWKYGWGPQDDQRSIETVQHALELGINWIDTAAVYGNGHAEEVVGKAIRGMSERPFIATKCSRKISSDGPLYSDLKKESVVQETEDSLRRLGIEVIDLMQIHWPKPEAEIEEGWEAIATLIQQGKIRYGGVSNFDVAHMLRCIPIHPIASLQPPYNMLVRNIENEIIPFCEKHRIGILCYSPLYKGLFTGAFNKERVRQLPETDHRRNDPFFQEPKLSVHLQLVENLSRMATERQITVAQLTLAWILRHEQVTAAIVGGRRPEQLDETAKAGDIRLDDADINRINDFLEKANV